MRRAPFLPLALLALTGSAAELERIDVSSDDGVYRIHAEAGIDAPYDAVHAVITDYNHMHWITGAVLESNVLERPEPGVAVVFVKSRACFGIFCKTIKQVQRVDARETGLVVFETVPGRGDLEQGRSEWRLQKLGEDRTRLTWDMMMDPDFWVPPLIGPSLIKTGLAGEGRDMIRGIEKLANEREARR